MAGNSTSRGVVAGKKLRRTGGNSWEPVRRPPSGSPGCGPAPRLARVPKGPYPFKPQLISDDRRPVKQRPLNPVATKLLTDYYKRAVFWRACRDGAPVEWAGETILGLKKGRAYQIYNEMDPGPETDADLDADTDLETDLDLEADCDPGPYYWFRREALVSMQAGRIFSGRATEGSKLADAFFAVLAGGRRKYEALTYHLEGSHQIDLRLIRSRLPVPDAQALDYHVYSRTR